MRILRIITTQSALSSQNLPFEPANRVPKSNNQVSLAEIASKVSHWTSRKVTWTFETALVISFRKLLVEFSSQFSRLEIVEIAYFAVPDLYLRMSVEPLHYERSGALRILKKDQLICENKRRQDFTRKPSSHAFHTYPEDCKVQQPSNVSFNAIDMVLDQRIERGALFGLGLWLELGHDGDQSF